MPTPYISEAKYNGIASVDFVEVAVDAGTDVSNMVVTIYRSDGTVKSTNSLSSLTHTTIAGRDVYVIKSGSPNSFSGIATQGGIALSDGTTVHQFISFTDNAATVTATGGAAAGLTSTDVGQAGAGNSIETTDNGATYNTQTAPNPGTIPCLTKGTGVQTDMGMVNVEDLKPGMRPLTMDGTYAPLRLALSKTVTRKEFLENEKLAPVRITAGALGLGLPKTDMLVSRQHRMLVSSAISKRMFNETHVLVAAIRLVELPGIYVDTSVADVEYFHLLMESHHVIFAEGAPTESLFVGEHIKPCLPEAVREEIALLFPEITRKGYSPTPACTIPSRQRQKQLIARHAKNVRDLLSQQSPALCLS